MNCFFFLVLSCYMVFSMHMSQTSWFEEKTTTVGLVAGFFGGKNGRKIV